MSKKIRSEGFSNFRTLCKCQKVTMTTNMYSVIFLSLLIGGYLQSKIQVSSVPMSCMLDMTSTSLAAAVAPLQNR